MKESENAYVEMDWASDPGENRLGNCGQLMATKVATQFAWLFRPHRLQALCCAPFAEWW